MHIYPKGFKKTRYVYISKVIFSLVFCWSYPYMGLLIKEHTLLKDEIITYFQVHLHFFSHWTNNDYSMGFVLYQGMEQHALHFFCIFSLDCLLKLPNYNQTTTQMLNYYNRIIRVIETCKISNLLIVQHCKIITWLCSITSH